MLLSSLLEKLRLPDPLRLSDGQTVTAKEQWVRRRKEIFEMLCAEEYGFLPPAPAGLRADVSDRSVYAGKANIVTVSLAVTMDGGTFAFPVRCVMPDTSCPCPAFLYISFNDCLADPDMPLEDILGAGMAVVSFCYTDVTADNGDFSDGLAGLVYRGAKRASGAPGKLALWAWAAMRVMDFMQGLAGIDRRNIALAGHSRLGKTALLAGAADERFTFVISNESGCGGAALHRGKAGERIADICETFPYWFCENFQQYAGREDQLPFDQHFLLSLIAPRKLYVASAQDDAWAGPESEFLSCAAAGKVYELLGEHGLVTPDGFPQVTQPLLDGSIGYHLREGRHGLSRYDWLRFVEYVSKHILIPHRSG